MSTTATERKDRIMNAQIKALKIEANLHTEWYLQPKNGAGSSALLYGYLSELLWRETAAEKALGRKRRSVTPSTYCAETLRGKAKIYAGKYAGALQNAYYSAIIIVPNTAASFVPATYPFINEE